jgi:hypothetical protein
MRTSWIRCHDRSGLRSGWNRIGREVDEAAFACCRSQGMTDIHENDPNNTPEDQGSEVSDQRLVRGLSKDDLKEIARVLELLRGWGDEKPE